MNIARPARSRRKLIRKLTRVKHHSAILGVLLVIYIGTKVMANIYVFHPVQALANTDNTVVTIEKKVPVIHIEQVDRRFDSQYQQILAYIVEKFGDRAGDAITMIDKCENHAFDPVAINYNRNGTIDVGIMQINVDPKDTEEVEKLKGWKYNIDRGYGKYTSRGNKFTDWTCASVIGEKNYLGK